MSASPASPWAMPAGSQCTVLAKVVCSRAATTAASIRWRSVTRTATARAAARAAARRSAAWIGSQVPTCAEI